MSNFSDWQNLMLRAVWRHREQLPEEVLAWMSELYGECGEMAEGVQEFVMSHHRVTWPVCDQHDRGLHVGYFHETAVWTCTGGTADGHVVRAIDPAVQL